MKIHATDAIGFTPLSNYYKGAVEHKYLESIGFEYVSIGTHDFTAGPASFGNNFLASSTLQCVASNVLVNHDSPLEPFVKPYITKEYTNITTNEVTRVALISYLSEATCGRTRCGDIDGPAIVRVRPVGHFLRDFLDNLKFTEHPDVVIAISSGSSLADDIAIAKTVPGIDVILTTDGTAVMSNDATVTARKGSYPMVIQPDGGRNVLIAGNVPKDANVPGLGRLDLTFRNNAVVNWDGKIDPLLACTSTPDPACTQADSGVQADIANDLVAVQSATSTVIGRTDADLISACRQSECTGMDVMCDAIMWGMGDTCDAVFLNGGSIAVANPIMAGDVTIGKVDLFMPFKNYVAMAGIRGADIVDMFINGLSRANPAGGDETKGTGRFPQVSNLRATFNRTAPLKQRVLSVEIKNRLTGIYETIEPKTVYQLCTNDYLRGGGDDYTMLATNAVNAFDKGPQLDVLFKQYLAAPQGGRVREADSTGLGDAPPFIIGNCSYSSPASKADSGILGDLCDGDLVLDPEHDLLTITSESVPVLVKDASNMSFVPANYTALPNSLDIANLGSLQIRLTSDRVLTGPGLRIAYTTSDKCPPGYASADAQCQPCPAGMTAQAGDMKCMACPAGTSGMGIASAGCMECANGTFADAPGLAQCMECNAGRVWQSARPWTGSPFIMCTVAPNSGWRMSLVVSLEAGTSQ
ncbi:hypothetical protein HK097_005396 [Rhizophlyctis rosea]|uniref:5'-Nucleotidase C-terminal domain-containing protein n=1 Tax=Rhizophlyctis rosea TaxID=64517 RepID=A0AAD5X375_9FUNG|nr:hypothetical protein HK097_005396 [Rhizophlyctis rosea]